MELANLPENRLKIDAATLALRNELDQEKMEDVKANTTLKTQVVVAIECVGRKNMLSQTVRAPL